MLFLATIIIKKFRPKFSRSKSLTKSDRSVWTWRSWTPLSSLASIAVSSSTMGYTCPRCEDRGSFRPLSSSPRKNRNREISPLPGQPSPTSRRNQGAWLNSRVCWVSCSSRSRKVSWKSARSPRPSAESDTSLNFPRSRSPRRYWTNRTPRSAENRPTFDQTIVVSNRSKLATERRI